MPGIPGYSITQDLYASANSRIYRARRTADDRPVILKLINQDFPSPERIAWFRREYEILRTLKLPGVVAAYSLEHDQQHWMIVLEDFGGDSLQRLRLAGKLDLASILKLAIDVAEILSQVHQHYIMHKTWFHMCDCSFTVCRKSQVASRKMRPPATCDLRPVTSRLYSAQEPCLRTSTPPTLS